MFPRTEKLSTKAIWKVSIDGENLLSPCFGIPGPEVPVEKHLKGLLRNPGKEAITVVLLLSITACRLLHGSRTFDLGSLSL